jgi:hypothetical protein
MGQAMLKPESFLAQCQMIANELHTKCEHLLFTAHEDKHRPDLYASIKVESLETNHNDHDCRLLLNIDGNRIIIRGNKPQSLDGTEYPTESETWPQQITVSRIRSASAIANEICKRLLDQYLEQFPEAAIERDLHDEAATSLNERAHEIADLIGGKIKIDRIKDGGPGQEFGHVREIIISSETVHLNISRIPFDLAKEMLRVWMHGSRQEKIREFSKLTSLGHIDAKRLVESATGAVLATTKSKAETEDKEMREFWLSAAATAIVKMSELATKRGFTVDFIESTSSYYLVRGDERVKIPTFDE